MSSPDLAAEAAIAMHATPSKQGARSSGPPKELDDFARKLRRPCCATFGFGGRVAVLRTQSMPSGPVGAAVPGKALVMSTREMLLAADEAEAVAMQSFPGPLVHGACTDDEVRKWLKRSLKEPVARREAGCRGRAQGVLGLGASSCGGAALHAALDGVLVLGPKRFSAAVLAGGLQNTDGSRDAADPVEVEARAKRCDVSVDELVRGEACIKAMVGALVGDTNGFEREWRAPGGPIAPGEGGSSDNKLSS